MAQTAAAGICKAIGHMSGGTTQRELLRDAKASTDAVRAEKLAQETARMILADCVATDSPETLTMEWTGFGSWIIPVCVVTGRIEGNQCLLTAATGPGREELSAVWLRAFVIATMETVKAKKAARLAAEGGRA